jgi:hypothetical protein
MIYNHKNPKTDSEIFCLRGKNEIENPFIICNGDIDDSSFVIIKYFC